MLLRLHITDNGKNPKRGNGLRTDYLTTSRIGKATASVRAEPDRCGHCMPDSSRHFLCRNGLHLECHALKCGHAQSRFYYSPLSCCCDPPGRKCGYVHGPADQHSLADKQARIAFAMQSFLKDSETPSAQVGVIEHGRVVYTAVFGRARLNPSVEATTTMPYGIGSVSKQFTAATTMVLFQQGKLRLDDPVSTWFPELAHSKEITLRNLFKSGKRVRGLLHGRLPPPAGPALGGPVPICKGVDWPPLELCTWHAVAIQQYELPRCFSDCSKSDRNAVSTFCSRPSSARPDCHTW